MVSADDVLWPVERHNREYLRHLPRDEFDEFVWSVKDRDVAFGTFDRNEWGFTLGKDFSYPSTFVQLFPQQNTSRWCRC